MPATKIMMIRHGEKPDGKQTGIDADGKEDAEELVVRGWQRSGALVRLFAPQGGKFTDPHLAQPNTIFASGTGKHSNSLRAQHTVLELANALNLSLDLRFPKGSEQELAKVAPAAAGPVLIAWEHEAIPDIVNAIIAGDNTTCPQKWPGSRFDMVWVLDHKAAGSGWDFNQVPQLLLSGDRKDPIA
jgi:broad specificity phosphatase PhoE